LQVVEILTDFLNEVLDDGDARDIDTEAGERWRVRHSSGCRVTATGQTTQGTVVTAGCCQRRNSLEDENDRARKDVANVEFDCKITSVRRPNAIEIEIKDARDPLAAMPA
jgi:hypothetical protein